MHPFIHIKNFNIPLYGLCIAIGILLSGFFVYLFCKAKGKIFYDFLIIYSLTIFFGFIGAKLFYLVLYYPLKNIPEIIFKMLFKPKETAIGQGFVFYGGIITGAPAYFLGCKIAKCKPSEFFPEATIILPFIHGFGRIGCFFAGCCYGIPYEGPFALHYSSPLSDVSTDCGIFPVQLLEAFLTISFSIVLIVLYRKEKPISFIYYMLYYSCARFLLEYLRGDIVRKHFGPFSTSQWISLLLFITAIVILIIKQHIKLRKNNMT